MTIPKLNRKSKKLSKKRKSSIGDIISLNGYKGNYLEFCIDGKSQYLAVIKIFGIDYESLSPDDISTAFSSFAKATQSIKLPHKYVFTTSQPDLHAQLDYITYKQEKTESNYEKYLLQREVDRFNYFADSREDRQDYMLVTADNPQDLTRGIGRYINSLKNITAATICTPTESTYFLQRYLTLNSPEAISQKVSECTPSRVTVRDTHLIIDGQYVTSFLINSFPSFVGDFDLANIICNRYSDCIVTLDVEENNKQSTIRQIKKSVEELNGRSAVKYQKQTDHLDNAADFEMMTELYQNLSRGYEQIISTTYRIYVIGSTLEEMQNKLRDIINDLGEFNIQGFVRVNELLEEYKALIIQSNYVQTALPLHDTYKKQFPFYDESLIDSKGIYMGESQSGGIVAIDFFNRSPGRESYDIMTFGLKGSGKTILFKSMIQKQIMQGNKVYAIDIENEYGTLAKVLGGTSIRFTRSSTINPLQIRNAIVSSVDSDNVETNFACEISRIITFVHIYSPALSADASELLRKSLVELYLSFGIDESTDVTQLRAEDFPTFRELSKQLKNTLYEADGITFKSHYTTSDLEAYRELIRLSESLAEQSMFGNHSNVNFDTAKFVVFNVKALSEMDDNVFNAQLFNIISIMWAEVCNNVMTNINLAHPYDRVRVICLADEAHRFINSKNPIVLSFFEKLLRRSRKYDAALWFATQSVLDINPEGTDAGFNSLRRLFDLVQYKIILKQQSNCFNHLKNTFYQLTDGEIQSTADFEAGQMIILLGSGRHKIHCDYFVDRSDLLYFGNSQDVEEIIKGIYDSMYSDYNPQDVKAELREDSTYFKETFAREVFDDLGLKASDNEIITSIVMGAIDNLITTLLRGGAPR